MVKLELLTYSTDWDRKIEVINNKYSDFFSENDVFIAAHANSYVSFIAKDSGRFCIYASTKPWASNSAEPSIKINNNFYRLLYFKQFDFNVNVGDKIELLFNSEDIGRCWTYWILKDVSIYKPFNGFFFNKHTRLGDGISILCGLNQIGKDTNTKVFIHPTETFKSIANIFHFPFIEFKSDCGQYTDGDSLFGGCSWRTFWLNRFYDEVNKYHFFKDNNKYQLEYPKLINNDNVKKHGKYCVQFDSRSAKNINKEQILKTIFDICGNNFLVVGGEDTSRYLGDNVEYSLGNLNHIIKLLRGSEGFVGCDSGIGHLAGVLGIKSYIYPLIDRDAVKSFFDYNNTIILRGLKNEK